MPDRATASEPAPMPRPHAGLLVTGPLVAKIRPWQWCGLVGLALLLYSVYGYRPLVADANQWADDFLYTKQAEAILLWLRGDAREWLGPYDSVLLGKAPLFAIWLAGLHLAHIPLRFAEYVLLLTLPWLFRAAVRPMCVLSWWQFAGAVVVLVALPFLPTEQRLLRGALQVALTSACQIATIGLILRVRHRDGRPTAWAALIGLLAGLVYLNREEGIWLLPMVFIGLVAVGLGAWSTRSWRSGAVTLACLIAAAAAPVTVVSALNLQSYGLFLTTTRRAPQFTRAHRVLTSLEPETRQRYVPIRESTRLKAYRVSPSFARLRGYFEGPETDPIARHPIHLYMNDRPPEDREFFVSSFQFVLQEAVYRAGARTAVEAEALFRSIARELESAVALGWISAGSKGPATLAAPLPGDTWRVLRRTVTSLWKLYSLEGLDYPEVGDSSGPVEGIQRMARLARSAATPTQEMRASQPPDTMAPARRFAYARINALLVIAYVVGTIALLAFIVATAIRHRQDAARVDQALVGVALCASLLAFSAGMALVDVLGFSLLRWAVASYNNMGYSPLSVLSGFGLLVLTDRSSVLHRLKRA